MMNKILVAILVGFILPTISAIHQANAAEQPGDTAALKAKIAALEKDNNALRAENNRLRGLFTVKSIPSAGAPADASAVVPSVPAPQGKENVLQPGMARDTNKALPAQMPGESVETAPAVPRSAETPPVVKKTEILPNVQPYDLIGAAIEKMRAKEKAK